MAHESVEQFSVRLLEIGGLGAALQALRLPYGKDSKSEASFDNYWSTVQTARIGADREKNKTSIERAGYDFEFVSKGVLHRDDMILISALISRGDEHAKILRGVMVWCEIYAPRYWWQECDTYRVGAERLSSESTMHIQGRGMNEDELVEMKENLVEGTMQKRVWMFSYQTLRRIYFQRRDHRLPQWRKFCKWIETLPFAKDFILIETRKNIV